jgi:hypothetical protein
MSEVASCHRIEWIGMSRTPGPSMKMPLFDEPVCPECGGGVTQDDMGEDEASGWAKQATACIISVRFDVETALARKAR